MQKIKLSVTSVIIGLLAACSQDTATTTIEKIEAPDEPKAVVPSTFADQVAPPIPNYNLPSSWAAMPENPGSSLSKPQNSLSSSIDVKDVDVFYIHPTTYKSSTRWNQDIRDTEVNRWTDESVIARQASSFNECCQIYAPYYRQASFLATQDRLMQGDGGKAYDLAYSDILRAFDHFIEKQSSDRPFILAGHSQGAEHSYRLLRDRIDGSSLQSKMVAAYVVGLDLTQGAFGKEYKTLEVCSKPSQIGCVLGWNAINTEADLTLYSTIAGQRYVNKFGTEEGRQTVCVNPLTFDVEKPIADKTRSLGAISGTPGFGPLGKLIPNSVNASCQKGFLVTDYDASLDLDPLPGGSLHYHDFGLFYQNIKLNAAERIAAYQSTR